MVQWHKWNLAENNALLFRNIICLKTDSGPDMNAQVRKYFCPTRLSAKFKREAWKPAVSVAVWGQTELYCDYVLSWFLFRRIGCVEFEKDNISILHDVVPALLPVFPSSLRRRHIQIPFNDVWQKFTRAPPAMSLYEATRKHTLTALSVPSSLKSLYFITSAMMKPFSKSVWIFPAAWGALVPFCWSKTELYLTYIITQPQGSKRVTQPHLSFIMCKSVVEEIFLTEYEFSFAHVSTAHCGSDPAHRVSL